jgi:transcription termination/antitermination protein NusG
VDPSSGDDHGKLMEEPMIDDAESNRSDDTALDNDVAVSADDDGASDEAANGDVISQATTEDEAVQSQAAEDGAEAEQPAGDESAAAEEETPEEQAAGEEQEEGEEEGEADEEALAAGRKRPPAPAKKEPEAPEEIRMDWYILKVQSNRERSISEALERKMRIEGLDRYFDQVIVPTEKVTEFKGGKKKVVERKLYPGYIVVHMHINDDTWFAVRETSGVGDFTGAGGKPTPMQPHEVARIIQTEEEETSEAPKLDIKFSSGDKVKVKEGNFESFEGEVGSIDEASGRVIVMINIFGRSTPVELEYWQIELM